jgi:hypothetical protein
LVRGRVREGVASPLPLGEGWGEGLITIGVKSGANPPHTW